MNAKISSKDPLYPPLLRESPDPPRQLFIRGLPLDPTDRYFAIVGTRRPSLYGRQMAREFSRALAQSGFTIVSGLAYGIDEIAHRAALEASGKTIAVLGSGFHHIGPPSNLGLAARIETSGTLVTEYESHIAPTKFTFPHRNRIIAGMSMATLMIEGPEKSGALITARLALEANRPVFALPANITQESSAGGNRLIKECAAFPVTRIEDIFEYLDISHGAAKSSGNTSLASLSSDEKIIYERIKQSPVAVEIIAAETGFSPAHMHTVLFQLECKRLITISGAYVLITR